MNQNEITLENLNKWFKFYQTNCDSRLKKFCYENHNHYDFTIIELGGTFFLKCDECGNVSPIGGNMPYVLHDFYINQQRGDSK